MTSRREDLQHRLGAVQQAIEAACSEVGRDPASVHLIAVSKTWPVADIEVLYEAGVRAFGENRVEELAAKAEAMAGSDVCWHYLGQIQSKKAAAIGAVASVVHSLDRDKVLRGLSHGARDARHEVDVLIQVSLADLAGADEAAGRGGAPPQDVAAIAAVVAGTPWLRLGGVMTLPPRSVEPAIAFARLATISAQLRQQYPGATWVSAGMSHDFPAAIAAGATHVRVGSALFGERSALR